MPGTPGNALLQGWLQGTNGTHQLWTPTSFEHLYLSLLVLLDYTAQEASHAGKTDWQISHNWAKMLHNEIEFNFAEERFVLFTDLPLIPIR